MSALNSIRKYVLACAMALAVVSMAVVALMMLTITYDVVVRFTFSAPTDWAYPLNAAGVLAATSLAIPYFYAKGQHISMDLVHRALPHGLRRVADVVTAVATAFLGVVLAVTAYRSLRVAIDGGLTGSGTFSIPYWIPDAVLCLSGVLLAVVAVLFPPGGGGDGADAGALLAGQPGQPSAEGELTGAEPAQEPSGDAAADAAADAAVDASAEDDSSRTGHASRTPRTSRTARTDGGDAASGTGEGENRS
ncbi:TRAP transporter small permease [Streptomyces sp. HNM0575]|uniref:TRAP transporter small permease n=1 Tax=Streptomyces sp. HNM0575 TaxID=2716338 RepID=UPI00145E08CF|nr:TRAP transporter small permease [Streptomyces sp. HNM0575]NLU73628.1 TRAP transporter small permease [Streptomyces sp. HNM0575]